MAGCKPTHSRHASETVSLRARNPSRILAPHHHALQSSSRHYVNLQCSTSEPRNWGSHVATPSQGSIGMATPSSSHSRNLSRPPRNHSFLESATNPIPRLPSTRLPYQSFSYHLSNSHELHHHVPPSTKPPRDQAFTAATPKAHPPTFNPLHSQPDLATSDIATYASQNRIKFAPLPNKPNAPAYPFGPKSEFTDLEPSKLKQFSKKKAPWIGRWLSPSSTQASKNMSDRIKQEISLPVPQTLIITGTATGTTSAMVPSLPIKRRSSLNDQHNPKDTQLKPPRPRSRSLSSARVTLSMMANMVQGSPSRTVEETLASGKTLLHASQHICSPSRAQSLRNLIADNSLTSTIDEKNADDSPHDLQIHEAEPIEQPDRGIPLEAAQNKTSGSGKPAEQGINVPKMKKKSEIRFRNTLELIPNPDFMDPPQIVLPASPNSSSERLDPPLRFSATRFPGRNKRKSLARNLNPFSHLRKPRSIQSDRDDLHLLDATADGTMQSSHQSKAYTDLAVPNNAIKHGDLLLPRNTRHANHGEAINLSTRKLAPKINLTFVDLDHHIGSRFSVNTLFKEVQKSLPDVIPHEETRSVDSAGSEYDPISEATRRLTSRKGPEPTNEDRSEGKDGSSSDTLESPTTTTSISNPVDMQSSHPYVLHSDHNSVIEVVKTNGADVVFQMVVPVTSSGMKTTNSSDRTATGLAPRGGAYNSLKGYKAENEEDDLTVLSERLVALNKSIQARDARSRSSRGNSPNRSNDGLAQNLSATKRKINRIENWLSNVPSPLASPIIKVRPPSLNLNPTHQFLKVQDDELENLDQSSEYPESPIDRQHIPPRPVFKTS